MSTSAFRIFATASGSTPSFDSTRIARSAPFAGLNWQIAPAITFTGTVYYDHMSNAAIGGGARGSGSRYTLVALTEYALSKQTEIYGTVEYNHVSGAADVELPGSGNQVGVGIGLRHAF
ncbi:hypothetical protein KTE44_22920 [Burkholderia multivorans]|nr:hypothetical protein [Burkholderia multivorans]